MRNNNFVFNEEEMNNNIANVNKLSYNAEDSYSKSSAGFTDLKDSGLFGEGINAISNKLNTISSSITNLKDIVDYSTARTVSLENHLSKIAEEIEVPHDFILNDGMKFNSIDDIKLSKNDGRAITDGIASSTSSYDDKSDVKVQNLESIVKDDTEKIDDNIEIDVNSKELNNVNNGKEQEEKELNLEVETDDATLTNIVNNNTQQKVEMDDINDIDLSSLKSMGTNSVGEIKDDFNYNYSSSTSNSNSDDSNSIYRVESEETNEDDDDDDNKETNE